MAQRASPPLTTLCSRLAWSLQNGGVAVSLRAFSAMAIRGRVQTLGWQHGQRGAVAARGAEFKRSMPGGAAEEGGRRRREKQRKKESERKREKEEEDTKVVGAQLHSNLQSDGQLAWGDPPLSAAFLSPWTSPRDARPQLILTRKATASRGARQFFFWRFKAPSRSG